jgi:hypothetical protein
MNSTFPKMVRLRQDFPRSAGLDIRNELRSQMSATRVLSKVSTGMRVGVGVGSRGITGLAEIVRETLTILREAGAVPFIVPAMGSHGGATPEGQEGVLASLGISRESMGVPVESSMEVDRIGDAPGAGEVVFSRAALHADAVIVINRIKPHTDFSGTLGSGILKMLAVGFGKHVGAANIHRAASRYGHEAIIRAATKVILDKVNVLCGIAVIENQLHQTSKLKVLAPGDLVRQEEELLREASASMARLPFKEIDLLIVDEIGKEFSGTGMDTNVIGRGVFGYTASLTPTNGSEPHIARIMVRDLSKATHGNAIGIGLADFTTRRAFEAIDFSYMYTNALTSLGLPTAKIPMFYDTDKATISAALSSLGTSSPELYRVARIANTLDLGEMLVSEPLLGEAHTDTPVSVVGVPQEMAFDSSGNLLPL